MEHTGVLSFSALDRLVPASSSLSQLLIRLTAGADTEEIRLRIAQTRERLDVLEQMLGTGPTGAFDNFAGTFAGWSASTVNASQG